VRRQGTPGGLRVGLTGGTGAGKSTVAGRLAELGAVVVDADALAREVVAPGSEGLRAVVAQFGDGVLAGDGSLDRAALAALVFTDARLRRVLEGITHPRIAARTRELVAGAPPGAVVVHDVPLLVEKRMGSGYHLVVVVDAPEEVRVARLVRSRGMAADDARARLRAQATDDERRASADVWLDNAASPTALVAAVDRLWRDRIAPFAENLRLGRPAPRPASVTVAPYDPTWPAQAARILERVRAAAGDAARAVDHVGSTAVPGLAAKDVIDVQLVVADPSTADDVAAALHAAGFPPLEERWQDRQHDDGSPLPERVHAACDPGRPVNLHVTPSGGPFAARRLLLRDWLRAHDDERDAYALVKQAAAGVGGREYAAAKDAWIAAAMRRAGAWAGTSD
jgi:dephospho-CoA kinase